MIISFHTTVLLTVRRVVCSKFPGDGFTGLILGNRRGRVNGATGCGMGEYAAEGIVWVACEIDGLHRCRHPQYDSVAARALRAGKFAQKRLAKAFSAVRERKNGFGGLKIVLRGHEPAKNFENRVATGVEWPKTTWERQKTAKMAPQTQKTALRTLAESIGLAPAAIIPGFWIRRAKNRPK